jgi:hypothetical protein
VLQVERGWPPYSYLDTEGRVIGFHKELGEAVCSAGGLVCEIVYGSPTDCFDEHQHLGDGMQNKWYDGCIGWAHTHLRQTSSHFSAAWTMVHPGAFYERTGEDHITCTGDTCEIDSGAKIGIIEGWATSKACLELHGLLIDHEVVLYHAEDLLDGLRNDEIDVAFYLDMEEGHPEYLGPSDGVEDAAIMTGDTRKVVNCLYKGYGVAVRRDSAFLPVWNSAFNLVKHTAYAQLCARNEYLDVPCCTGWNDLGACTSGRG